MTPGTLRNGSRASSSAIIASRLGTQPRSTTSASAPWTTITAPSAIRAATSLAADGMRAQYSATCPTAPWMAAHGRTNGR